MVGLMNNRIALYFYSGSLDSLFCSSKMNLFLLLISNLLFTVGCVTFPGDIGALKDLQNGIEPSSITPGSCLSSWDFSVDPCDNAFSDKFTCGFRCDLSVQYYRRVTEISLDKAGYAGSLTDHTGDLFYLQTLDIPDNLFGGQIPASLSKLTNLQRLSLSHNSFSGNIPDSLGSLSGLQELYLDNNFLEGHIPASFSGLRSLKRLELQTNKLTGEFPNLDKNLNYLDASDNKLSGQFPATLPESLIEISMRNNNLVGQLPGNLGDLTSLQVMDLSYNQLSGALFSVLFNHPSLQQLQLSHNQFSLLQVPGNLGINSELIAIDLGFNKIQWLLPVFVTMMPKLSALSLENNYFTGMIPAEYAIKTTVPGEGQQPFVRLLLSGNYLFGSIPNALTSLKPGSAMVSLVDNCLYQCPSSFFFCQGAKQKSSAACKSFSVPVIP